MVWQRVPRAKSGFVGIAILLEEALMHERLCAHFSPTVNRKFSMVQKKRLVTRKQQER